MNQPSPSSLVAAQLELWRGDRLLFSELDVSLGPREVLQVRGPNGSGKSSLLRVLSGLLPADEGDIRWNRERIERARPEFHRALSFLGHRNGLSGDLTAAENLKAELQLRRTVTRAEIADALGRMGVAALAELPLRVLSAGQQRRVAFARTLLHQAPLWMLDEPFTNLDAEGRDLIEHLIDEQVAGGGMVVLAAHHTLDRIEPTRTLDLG